MSYTKALEKYRAKRAIVSPWRLEGETGAGFRGAVVIPALAEYANLPATLESLAQGLPEITRDFLVVVVVNHREDAAGEDKADNYATLACLPELASRLPLNLAWIDAASSGLELPARIGGVGMARKLGFDLALPHLSWQHSLPLLVALDGDTLVDEKYLAAVTGHFDRATCGGAVIPFRHRPVPDPDQQEIIDRYELFLRAYVLGLACAKSPYAFHTVGSAMACTGPAYLAMGGMNTRQAAEDFYFLQQLRKTAGISQVAGTVVHPSSRPSHRVPFGTGRSVARALDGDDKAITFYQVECFHVLRDWLQCVEASYGKTAGAVMDAAAGLSATLAAYLEGEGFLLAWERIARCRPRKDSFFSGFHEWFDALRTMKLVHALSAADYRRCRAEDAVAPLLAMSGLIPVAGVSTQLTLLRRLQTPGPSL